MSEKVTKMLDLQEIFNKVVEFHQSFGDATGGFAYSRSAYGHYNSTCQFLLPYTTYADFKAFADKIGLVVRRGHLNHLDTNQVYVYVIYENIEFGTFVAVAEYER